MFTRRLLMQVALIFLVVFALSAVGGLVSAKPPYKCEACKKEGCPEGYCYVDCIGCCYNHPQYGVICFR